MIFSELFKYSSIYPVFSPNGAFIAVANNYKLIIKDIKSIQTFKVYTCVDSISEIKWSNDSLFVLCVLKKRNIIQVWSLEYSEWHCKINEGSAGLIKCDWCPDSRHILTTLDFFIRITLWSIEEQNVSYMKYPKNCAKFYDFSLDEKYFALAERRNFKDYISIFNANKWTLLKNFQVATTDLDGIKWLEYSNLVCWDSCLRYNIFLYNINGDLLKSISNSSCDYQLGIRMLQYHPKSHLIIVGIFNSKCEVLNSNNLATIANIDCCWDNVKKTKFTDKSSNDKIIYYENDNGDYSIASKLDSNIEESSNFIGSRDKKCISDIQFSHDGLYFFTRFDGEPHILFIWSVKRIGLDAVLIHKSIIKSACWCPKLAYLALVTGNNRLYMWTPRGCVATKVPDLELSNLINVSWNPIGTNVCVSAKLSSCVVFINDDNIDCKNKK